MSFLRVETLSCPLGQHLGEQELKKQPNEPTYGFKGFFCFVFLVFFGGGWSCDLRKYITTMDKKLGLCSPAVSGCTEMKSQVHRICILSCDGEGRAAHQLSMGCVFS